MAKVLDEARNSLRLGNTAFLSRVFTKAATLESIVRCDMAVEPCNRKTMNNEVGTKCGHSSDIY